MIDEEVALPPIESDYLVETMSTGRNHFDFQPIFRLVLLSISDHLI